MPTPHVRLCRLRMARRHRPQTHDAASTVRVETAVGHLDAIKPHTSHATAMSISAPIHAESHWCLTTCWAANVASQWTNTLRVKRIGWPSLTLACRSS